MKRIGGKSTNTFVDAVVFMVVVFALLFTNFTIGSEGSRSDAAQMAILRYDSNLNVKEVQRITSMTNDDVCDDCDDDTNGSSGQNKQPNAFIYSIAPNPAHEFDAITFEGYGEDADGTVISYRWESNIDSILDTNPSFVVSDLKPGTHTITFLVQDDDLVWSKPVNKSLEIQENQAPLSPFIAGDKKGTTGEEQEYTFITTDPEDHQVLYFVDWGDGTTDEWVGPYASDSEITLPHTWAEKGTYSIKAKAKDVHGAESDWTTLEIQMPLGHSSYHPFFTFFVNRLIHKFTMFPFMVG